MNTSNLSIFEEYESEVRSYCRSFPVVLTRARGSFVFDRNGNRYIDFFCGAGAINYGHNNEAVKAALLEYIENDGILMSLDFHSDAKERFIQTFQEKILKPRGLSYKMQFTSPSGTSVVESAVKLARKYTGRQNVVAFTNAFHGMSATSLSLTGSKHHRQEVSHGAVTRLPFDGYLGADFDYIGYYRKLLEDQSSGVDLPAAIILETLQGEGGLNQASVSWLRGIRQLCNDFDIKLIVDDIQTGCGRTGRFFSFEYAEIVPDMVCLSKSIGAIGLPCAVLLFSPEIDVWQKGEDNGTFRGNNLAFVAADKMIQLYWSDLEFERILEQRSALLRVFCEEMQSLFSDRIASVKGAGLMQGLEFFSEQDTAAVAKACISAGLIIETCGSRDQTLKLMPALTIDEATLKQGMAIIKNALAYCLNSITG
ncbi:diaminobutyrate--2-oxoglutarate transaminase [Gynuella sunshinyii]|nr:diaminobutyrate--2-oxoglutarate transaminase [Gynuella sunshinyii]